ncbi:hypothetical protein BJV74DRAFT_346561 [Russula compacta]|nr:hypothetical protein BJV74DRAFT_346561 [Russula compacta]
MMLSKPFASLLATLAVASSIAAFIIPAHMATPADSLASCYFDNSTPQCCKVVQQTSSSSFLFFVGGDLYEYTEYGPTNMIGFDCSDYTSGDKCAATTSSVLCCHDTQLRLCSLLRPTVSVLLTYSIPCTQRTIPVSGATYPPHLARTQAAERVRMAAGDKSNWSLWEVGSVFSTFSPT